jgi:hypothetical protein
MILPHTRIEGRPHSLLVKLQELPAFKQASHHFLNFTKDILRNQQKEKNRVLQQNKRERYRSHRFTIKNRSAMAVNVKKYKTIQERLQYEVSGKCKERARIQRKLFKKAHWPMKNSKD